MTVRAGLKQAVEGLLIGAGVAAVSRARVRHRSLILAYHNVVPDGAPVAGDLSLHLPRSRFARQLDELYRHAEIVSLERVFAPAEGEGPRVAITFDDAYRGAVTAGLDELARRGLPATIFVAPGLLGGHAFWWDVLAEPAMGLGPEVRRHGLEALQGKDALIRAWAETTGRRQSDPPAHARSSSVEELAAALARGPFTVGSHSWSHASLSSLSRGEVAAELGPPRDWLAGHFGPAFIPWLSYPYGHFSPMVAEEAAAAGYRGALGIEGGWIPDEAPPKFAIPRFNVPAGLSPRGFALRIAGLFCR